MSSYAALLVSHGSRDPQPQRESAALATLVQAVLVEWHREQNEVTASSPLISTAVLECAPLPLHAQIQQFGEEVIRASHRQVNTQNLVQITLLPLFLLPGVHVKEDIPAQVTLAQQHFENRLQIRVCPYLGCESAKLGSLLNNPPDVSANAGRIVLGHGSRRAGGNQPVEAIAQAFNAIAAYWSVPPSLETQVRALIQAEYREIVVLPYILFAGGILGAIAQTLETLAQEFPHIRFHLAKPLGATPALAHLIADMIAA